MIIQGSILTDQGPIDIENLKAGDKVLDQMHRACVVTKIEKKNVVQGFSFIKNPRLMIAEGTILKTVHGDLKVEDAAREDFLMAQPNMRLVKDRAVLKKGKYTAYMVNTEGKATLFGADYCLGTEDNNA